LVDGLCGPGAALGKELGKTLGRLPERWFVTRDVHDGRGDALTLMQPRWAMSWMRGPMTRAELRRVREGEG